MYQVVSVQELSADNLLKQRQPACTNTTLRPFPPHTSPAAMDGSPSSIFVRENAPVYDMPLSAINRPQASTLDEAKVQQFVEDMKAGASFTPIEVAWVQDGGDNYYFAFGGCHRCAAVKQLALPTIRARLIKVSPSAIDTHLGTSSPFKRKKQQTAQQQGSAAAAGASTADSARSQSVH